MSLDDSLTTAKLPNALITVLEKGTDAGAQSGLDVQSIVTGVVVGAVVAVSGALVNYFAGAKRDRDRRNFEWKMQQERWKQEVRTHFQAERIEAYRDMHKASTLESLGLYHDPFSGTYSFDPRLAANGVDAVSLCHSEILLLAYSNKVREASARINSEAFLLRTKLMSRYNKGKSFLSAHIPVRSRRRGKFDGTWVSHQTGMLTRAQYDFIQAVTFFDNFDEEGAVQYFYEPFLEDFDPKLRKQLGIWYTPRKVVSYMVQRVDTVLQEELGISDGLADESVYVLDPCTGTGSYLVEVLKHIRRKLGGSGEDALTSQDLKRAATKRVFGFELLPAPFVVAHLQLGLFLQNMGAPLADESEERIGVYLTNALTGWEPPEDPKRHLPLPEFEEERDAAEEVKRKKPILVILGNPPYNGYAGVAMSEERDLSRAYKSTQRVSRPQGQGLNDLYVRFFRMAERQIVEGTKKGVVCFISNYSWLDGLSFTGMRERYLEEFDRIWIDSLNGDKYRTGKLTPDGKPDPSVMSTETNPDGIQVGRYKGAGTRGGRLADFRERFSFSELG